MRRLVPIASALAILMIATPPARAIDPATMATAGNGTVAACATCHGKDGGGQSAFPRLAGMNAAYLLKQLQDFASGSRMNSMMQPIAKSLTPADHVAMANYYAALPIPAPLATAAARNAQTTGPGERLATRGRWSDGVPACTQCHGPGGVGVGDNFPAIAAQPVPYIAAQLKAWKDGTRKNDPLELMRHVSARLSADEIDAVSQWFSRQPALASGGSS